VRARRLTSSRSPSTFPPAADWMHFRLADE